MTGRDILKEIEDSLRDRPLVGDVEVWVPVDKYNLVKEYLTMGVKSEGKLTLQFNGCNLLPYYGNMIGVRKAGELLERQLALQKLLRGVP